MQSWPWRNLRIFAKQFRGEFGGCSGMCAPPRLILTCDGLILTTSWHMRGESRCCPARRASRGWGHAGWPRGSVNLPRGAATRHGHDQANHSCGPVRALLAIHQNAPPLPPKGEEAPHRRDRAVLPMWPVHHVGRERRALVDAERLHVDDLVRLPRVTYITYLRDPGQFQKKLTKNLPRNAISNKITCR